MILNKPQQSYLEHYSNAQRLGDKPLTQNYVKKKTGETVKYFSSIDAEIYFENIYIDEVTDIAFSVEQQAMPLFGYNSYVFDDIAVGARLVNGQFAINFTKAGYMYEVLDTMLTIQTGSQVKTSYISKRKPLWKNGFDIYVSYGNAKDKIALKGSSILVLRNVTLTSESQRFDYTGKPIQEVYTFVAQDIDFLNEHEPPREIIHTEKDEIPVDRTITATLNKVGSVIGLVFELPEDLNHRFLKFKDTTTGIWDKTEIFDNNTCFMSCKEKLVSHLREELNSYGESEIEIIYEGVTKNTEEEVNISDNVTVLRPEA